MLKSSTTRPGPRAIKVPRITRTFPPASTTLPRLAKNYRLVYEVLSDLGMGQHLPMTDVYQLVRRKQPAIGFTTVYRALTRLRDAGLVAEILLPGAESAVYERAGNRHSHFRCDSCGRVEDVDYVLSTRTVGDLARKQQVEISEVSLSLHGRCSPCRATADPVR